MASPTPLAMIGVLGGLLGLLSAQPSPAPHPGMPAWFNCTKSAEALLVSFGKPVGAIDCGTRIKKCPESPTQVEPMVRLPDADPRAGYVVMMVDGSNAARHWLIGNVPGKVLAAGFNNENATSLATATILQPYHGPHPPSPGTPGRTDYIHDYGQFVFKQRIPVSELVPLAPS